MECASYAVYEATTGAVIHVHTEPVDLGSSDEEILSHVDPRRDRDLRVLKLPGTERSTGPLYVVEGELRPAAPEVSYAGGGVAGTSGPPGARRQYTQEAPLG
ncbi:hypothetical protein [Streptomyces sp. NPDC055210]